MNLKNYLILEADGIGNNISRIKMKIRKGITADQITDTFNLEDHWEPSAEERIFFFPGCSVPRFKVREKFKVTIKPEYATAAFMSPKQLKSVEGLIDAQQYVTLESKVVEEYFDKAYGPSHFLTTKLKSILLNCDDQVLLNEFDYNQLYSNGPQDAIGLKAFGDVIIDRKMMPYPWIMKNKRSVEFYAINGELFDKLKCPIYSQDAILKILNHGKIVINETKYQELRLMANSGNKEDLTLVMELMANSDYDKSFVYLLILLKEFETQISNSPTVDHVNFKGLLEYFELTPKIIKNISIEQLTKTMKKLGKFTRSNVQRISQFYGSRNNYTDYDSTHYLNGPVLRPEVERELDDFVSDADEIRLDDETEY